MAHTIVAEATAPGKLILFGEHAVVYGATAVAAALSDLRVGVRVTVLDTPSFHITLPNLQDGTNEPQTTELDLDELRRHLSPHVSCHDVSAPVTPVEALMEALRTVTSSINEATAKAIIPTLFLSVALFDAPLLRPYSPEEDRQSLPPWAAGLHVRIDMPTLPIAAGLGSSAAFSVATAAALLHARLRASGETSGVAGTGAENVELHTPAHHTAEWESPGQDSTPSTAAAWIRPDRGQGLELINRWAFSAEMLFHGHPSGLDNTVSTYGGAIAFSRSPQRIDHITNMPIFHIIVVNTKVPKETSRLVAGVRTLHDAIPTVIRPIIQALDGVSRECVRLVEEKRHVSTESLPVPHPWHGLSSEEETASATGTVWSDDGPQGGTTSAGGAASARLGDAKVVEPWIAPASFVRKFGELVRISHNLLNALGVGHPSLDRVVRTAREFGAAAKLTGAGGGGCAFCVIPPEEEDNAGDATPGARHPVSAQLDVTALKAQLSEQGCDCFETNLGGWGVLVRGVDSETDCSN